MTGIQGIRWVVDCNETHILGGKWEQVPEISYRDAYLKTARPIEKERE